MPMTMRPLTNNSQVGGSGTAGVPPFETGGLRAVMLASVTNEKAWKYVTCPAGYRALGY